ncbi:Protein of unknown function [Gryllus bimaculatus]|nr:Protein of unknown function [Gryllus bimaculatus]
MKKLQLKRHLGIDSEAFAGDRHALMTGLAGLEARQGSAERLHSSVMSLASVCSLGCDQLSLRKSGLIELLHFG